VQQAVGVAMTRPGVLTIFGVLLALCTGTGGGTLPAAQDFPAAPSADLVDVPAGGFLMGTDRARDPQAFDNERWSPTEAEGRVSVSAFRIARHPVTVAEFTAFAREGTWTVDSRALSGPPQQPVAFVSWPDALAYCRWLERTWKTSPSTPAHIRERLAAGWRVTLPTEAEWEKAARTLDRQQFSWGAISEWTRSPYQPYPYDTSDDREHLDADALWVIRGGVFENGSRPPRATARTGADPGARRAFIGFRVAISHPH
jgi:formylglycine-generating enzyme required for sulfatase activity